MEKQKCPELRFSQFKNDWNETLLGDVVDIVGGGTPDTNVAEFWNGDIDWYSPTEIGENVYANGSIKKITAAGLKNSSAKILPAKKTVLFSSRAGIGDMAILNKPAATNQGFQSFIVNSIDVYFLYSMGVKIKKFALSKASGSTFLEISRNQLAQMEFFAPSIDSDEQNQIGNFFQNLDQSITLHEKKLTQTQNLKKAMLEKMFPKAGTTQPEIRLKGFSGEWGETTLGDVVDIVGGGTPDTNVAEFWNGDIDWYSPTEIGEHVYANGSIKKITASGLKNSSAKILPAKKTVLFSSRAGIGEMAILNKPAATNQGFQSFIANNIDVYFLYSMGSKIKKLALSKASGSTFLEISRNQLVQMGFLIPSFEEQKEIGNFFKQLDETLALQQQQLQTLKKLKQAFLEKMFV